MTKLILWDLYEISSQTADLNGIKLRGRVRRYANQNSINLLIENTEDLTNGVRFALLADSDSKEITRFIESIVKEVKISPVMTGVINPVLSKLAVNDERRYEVTLDRS